MTLKHKIKITGAHTFRQKLFADRCLVFGFHTADKFHNVFMWSHAAFGETICILPDRSNKVYPGPPLDRNNKVYPVAAPGTPY